MAVFSVESILVIKDIAQKPKTVTRVHQIDNKKLGRPPYSYKEEITGSIKTPKEFMGMIEKILEKDGINRIETEYVVRVLDPKGDLNKSMTRNYAESYLIRYARLLT